MPLLIAKHMTHLKPPTWQTWQLRYQHWTQLLAALDPVQSAVEGPWDKILQDQTGSGSQEGTVASMERALHLQSDDATPGGQELLPSHPAPPGCLYL